MLLKKKDGRNTEMGSGSNMRFRSVSSSACRHEQVMKKWRCIGHHGRAGILLVMTAEEILKDSGARRIDE